MFEREREREPASQLASQPARQIDSRDCRRFAASCCRASAAMDQTKHCAADKRGSTQKSKEGASDCTASESCVDEQQLVHTAQSILGNLKVCTLVRANSPPFQQPGTRPAIFSVPGSSVRIVQDGNGLLLETQQSEPVRYLSDAVTYTSDPMNFFRVVNFTQIAQNLLGLGYAEPKSCSVYLYGHRALPAPFGVLRGKKEHEFKQTNADACVDTSIRKLRKQRLLATTEATDDSGTIASTLISAILEQIQHKTQHLCSDATIQQCAPRLYLKAFQVSSCRGQVVDLLQALEPLEREVEPSRACPYYLVDSSEESTRLLRMANFRCKKGWQTVLIAAVVLGLSAPARTCDHVCGARVRLINVTGSGSPQKQTLGAFRDACMQRATLFSSLDLCASVLDPQYFSSGQPTLHPNLRRCDTGPELEECQALLKGTETADPVNETEVIVLFADFSITGRKQALDSMLFNQALSTLRFGDILSRARNVTYRRYSSMKNQGDLCKPSCPNQNTKVPPSNERVLLHKGTVRSTAPTSASAPQHHQSPSTTSSTTLPRRLQPRVRSHEKSTVAQTVTSAPHHKVSHGKKFGAINVQRSGGQGRASAGQRCTNMRVVNKALGPRDVRRKELVDLQRCIDELSMELKHRPNHSAGTKLSTKQKREHRVASKTTKDNGHAASTLTDWCQRVPDLNLYQDSRSGTVLHVPLPLDCPVPAAILKRFSRVCHCSVLSNNNSSPPVPRQAQPRPVKKSVPSPRPLDAAQAQASTKSSTASTGNNHELIQTEKSELSSIALHAGVQLGQARYGDELGQRLPKQPKAASAPTFAPPPRLDGYPASKVVCGSVVTVITTGKPPSDLKNVAAGVVGLDTPSLANEVPRDAVSAAHPSDGSPKRTNRVSSAADRDVKEDTDNQTNELDKDEAPLLDITNCNGDNALLECEPDFTAEAEKLKSPTSDQVSSKVADSAGDEILLKEAVLELDSDGSTSTGAMNSSRGTPTMVRQQRQSITDAIEKLLSRLGTLANAKGRTTMHQDPTCNLTPEHDPVCTTHEGQSLESSVAFTKKREFGELTGSADDVTPLCHKKCTDLYDSQDVSKTQKDYLLQVDALTPTLSSARKVPRAHAVGMTSDGCEPTTPSVDSGNSSSFLSDTTPSMSPFSSQTFFSLPVVASESKSVVQQPEVNTNAKNTADPQSPRKPLPSQLYDDAVLQHVQSKT